MSPPPPFTFLLLPRPLLLLFLHGRHPLPLRPFSPMSSNYCLPVSLVETRPTDSPVRSTKRARGASKAQRSPRHPSTGAVLRPTLWSHSAPLKRPRHNKMEVGKNRIKLSLSNAIPIVVAYTSSFSFFICGSIMTAIMTSDYDGGGDLNARLSLSLSISHSLLSKLG